MKKKIFNVINLVIASVILSSFFACSTTDPKEPEPTTPTEVVTIEGEITEDLTLTSNKQYLLKGFVYVTNSAELTIEPGTIIKGDKASKATLVIERGGKIWAQGTKNSPIVFTSNQPKGERSYGDWGGIVICGNAKVNTATGTAKIEGGPRSEYGGLDNNDNSGALEYVRIEFSGVEYATDNEINGLTLGGVGSATILRHIQVSYCGDDSYEFFGGTVNAKYLVAFRGWDDEFDTDNGFSGKLQFLVGLRDPNVADKSKSNGFESDNDASGSSNAPFTSPIFSNVSLFGPYTTLSDVVEPQGGNGDFQAAMHLRRNTKLKVYNSVFAGWPNGLFIENGGKGDAQGNATNGDLVVANSILAGIKTKNFMEDSKGTADFNKNYWEKEEQHNSVLTTNADLKLNNPFSLPNPNFTALANSPVLDAASFEYSPIKDDTFFEKVSFVGAFGTEDWTQGWTNWDPQNTDY
ncbi:MAG: hypothetical protein KBD91_07200 [Paludibacteraceae bacterium]|nr:hypothetical protein [Paludibacteraceae bacterium]MBP9649026.1 hypothetical protein [Paludibacteraceae bacterium]MBP9970837.1 hypothetical protein [Paludibacteraceae bacterium]